MVTSHKKVAKIVRRILRKHPPKKQLSKQAPWNKIFAEVFGQKPTGDDDPRWETLLFSDSGLGALHVAMNPDK